MANKLLLLFAGIVIALIILALTPLLIIATPFLYSYGIRVKKIEAKYNFLKKKDSTQINNYPYIFTDSKSQNSIN